MAEVILVYDIACWMLQLFRKIPFSHHDFHQTIEIFGHYLVATTYDGKAVEIKVEAMGEVEIKFASPFE
jgi:hypothetical protein